MVRYCHATERKIWILRESHTVVLHLKVRLKNVGIFFEDTAFQDATLSGGSYPYRLIFKLTLQNTNYSFVFLYSVPSYIIHLFVCNQQTF
jgi:hypothetical protein